MAVLWPSVVGWLATNCPTLPGWSTVAVFDGPANTGDDPTDYFTVGWTAPDAPSGQYDPVLSENGFSYDESGTVLASLVCQTGDDGPPAVQAVRTRAFDLVNALSTVVRADPTLGGVLSVNATVSVSAEVVPFVNAKGTAQELVITVTYFTLSF